MIVSNPAPSAASEPAAVQERFRYWQTRTLIASMVGYAAFYFVRKNLSVAMPAMQHDLGITKGDLGLFLTLHGLLYGISKFANGFWGDRVNARVFMVVGLLLSALANVAFGFSSVVLAFGIFWMINGWVQGMGFPPCARLMTHWFPPENLATKMSIWNTLHSIGAAAVVVFCGYVVGFGWRWCFFAPAAVAVLIAGVLWLTLRDTPSSVGLPEIKTGNTHGGKHDGAFGTFVRRQVFGNRTIWLIALANFFVYTVRYGILDWGPTLLREWKNIPLHQAGWMVAAFEIAGIVGMLVAGWCTDRFFGGRAVRVCVICMTGASVVLLLFWRLSSPPPWLATELLAVGGFFIYGPQALVGIAAANLATKRAAATAVGFTGIFGYLSTILSGWGLGRLVDAQGWGVAFAALLGVALVGTLLFAFAWRARAHGYADAS
jgi:sugar phosphate permease